MMLCVRDGRTGEGKAKIRMPDLTDIVCAVFISPCIWLLVTRAPVLATVIFSSALITA